jgi:septation ring formation regulator EzrA
MVQVLSILAVATKEMKRGRLSKLKSHKIRYSRLKPCLERYFKTLTGNTEIEDSLERLDKLTQEEARMASAELLKMTNNVDSKVVGVDNRVKGVDDRVKDVEGKVQDVRDDVQDVEHSVQNIGNNISSEVQGVDHKLDQVNRSLSL